MYVQYRVTHRYQPVFTSLLYIYIGETHFRIPSTPALFSLLWHGSPQSLAFIPLFVRDSLADSQPQTDALPKYSSAYVGYVGYREICVYKRPHRHRLCSLLQQRSPCISASSTAHPLRRYPRLLAVCVRPCGISRVERQQSTVVGSIIPHSHVLFLHMCTASTRTKQ